MNTVIRTADRRDLTEWIALRSALWPDASAKEHRTEITDQMESEFGAIAFLAFAEDGIGIGLAEASLRTDHVNGSETSPVAFLEGLYVVPSARRNGVVRGLIAAVERWALAMGCTELASDALISNVESHAVHEAAGFEETERVVFFIKQITRPASH